MAKVEIYTTQYCPYCVRAKALLSSKGVKFHEIKVDGQADLRRTMTGRAHGNSSVPQIFVDGEHIGDCDEIHALDRRGALDFLLK